LGDERLEIVQSWSEVRVMISSVALMEGRNPWIQRFFYISSLAFLATLILAGCRTISPDENVWPSLTRPRMLSQEQKSQETCIAFLSQMSLDEAYPVPDACVSSITEPPEQLFGASKVPDLTFFKENFVIDNSEPPPNSPVAWYKFDGDADDSAGNAHGLSYGNPIYAQGVYGKAIGFFGHGDSVHIPGAAKLFSSINTGITITFWQYGAISKHHKDTICCSDYDLPLNYPVITINLGCWNQPGQYNWDCGRCGSLNDRLSGEHHNQSEWSGRWNHWAFTKDIRSGEMQIFLNGRLFDRRTNANSPISGITFFEIGSGWYGDYDGLIDDFRIYDYALTSPQITYVATHGSGIFSQPIMSKLEQPSEGTCETANQKVFILKYLSNELCIKLLSKLNIGEFSSVPGVNAVVVNGSPEELQRASLVLELVDSIQESAIENLGPASLIRQLPSNSQIETAMGHIKIGTFSNPPQAGEHARGIIDIQGNSIVAILPACYREQLLDTLASLSSDMRADCFTQTTTESFQGRKTASTNPGTYQINTTALSSYADDRNKDDPKTVRVILKLTEGNSVNMPAATAPESATFENGDDIIDLDFPETMTLKQLLELAGEYLGLDYVYDPSVVGNQAVALKFQGGLKGEIKIKDLYNLLETVLMFNNLAMTRRGEKLVSIVPVGQVLDADPKFIDGTNKAVQAGDIVVTRIFKIKHVDVTSVANLLQHMKLGTVVSPSEETQLLFVTCYAHRMSRVEELVEMIDRPGRSRECRFRRLQYTTALALTKKLRALSMEVGGAPLAETSVQGQTQPQQNKSMVGPMDSVLGTGRQIYLEADERTNRIIMIGNEERLKFIEELVDALDVSQEDLRIPMTYDVKYMDAQDALNKLEELEVLGRANVSGATASIVAPSPSPAGVISPTNDVTHNGELTDEAKIVVLEATNQLLVRATQEQHARIDEFLDHIDVIPEDVRTLQLYEIRHVDAEDVKTKLEELEMVRAPPVYSASATPAVQNTNSGTIRRSNPPGVRRLTKSSINTTNTAEIVMDKPQVVVTESTNSLLVNATAEQHKQIATIIKYIDRKLPEADIPYKIYPLENSSPEHVADLLERLIHKTVKDEEGKIQEITSKEEQITIVPDPNTFSLIVYASRKNQEWIEKLAKSLDKRRPQVLIDVTLVEITRTEKFEYDLNIVASANDAVIGNIGIEPIHRINSKTRLEGSFNLSDQEGNTTGQTKAFYSDEKVQALLTAIKRKNYGRVLAKPKILVDDGQEGEISTTDETTYLKESVQVPNQGAPITTRDFEPIEAKIQLQITPHISEGDLLRLDVRLSRGDFGTRPAEGAPPDKTTSEVNTTVFVPDNNTVILGGLVKLNQSKGGSKVPILGDLPLVGALFRSVDNSDVEKKLYVFLKANIVRPYEEAKMIDLQKVSEENRKAFEESEAEFQKHEDIPGIIPKPMQPEHVLDEP
jgi:type II secretory pathway component GspD/PulD (secretin)